MSVKKAFLSALLLSMFVTLCGLSFWQFQRLSWKENLIRELTLNSAQPAIPLEQALDMPEAEYNYRRVRLSGALAADKILLVGLRQLEGLRGYWAVAPLKTMDAGVYTGRYAVVVLGFLPYEQAPGWTLRGDAAPIQTTAVVLPTLKPNWLTPANNPALKQWHHLFIEEIAVTYGLKPFFPMAFQLTQAPAGSGLLSIPVTPELSNNHLQYALTWLLLACGMVGYLLVLSRKTSITTRQ